MISDEDLSPKVSNYLDVINRNVNRLEALTDDLLNQQRIEEGRLNLMMENLHFQNIIHEAIEEIKGVLDQTKHTYVITLPDKPVHIMGDKLRLQQVTVNLLDNAIKYSSANSKIIVNMSMNNNFVEVTIQDEGIGLSDDDMNELFNPFPNIDRPVLTRQSVGLGLSISRGIIEMHGGKIWAESLGKGKGSVFKYVLPKKNS